MSTEVQGVEISRPAIFDLAAADSAINLPELKELHDFPALRLALALHFYNITVGNRPVRDLQKANSLFLRLKSLEEKASKTDNPLPTIGIEIETAKKIYDEREDSLLYPKFFDTIGFPRNKINIGAINASGKFANWEFSTPPSYTASVQNLIIAELIRGRFLPSIVFPESYEVSKIRKDRIEAVAENIQDLLSNKLISLHVNLGIPNTYPNLCSKENFTDALLLTSAISFAYTSPKRLGNRSTQLGMDIKRDSNYETSKSGKKGRVEVKSLEVRDIETYRFICDLQFLGAAMFSYTNGSDNKLAKIWMDFTNKIKDVYSKNRYQVENIKDIKVSHTTSLDINFVNGLRDIIQESSLRIRRALN